jgi:tRNA G46 methylase TrmB
VQQPSRPVTSSQPGIHDALVERVRRHLTEPWRRPVADHTRRAVDAAAEVVDTHTGPLLLDAGCGTGASSERLARRHPEALVLAVDKSADRLGRGTNTGEGPANVLRLRADLQDFWRLAHEADWRPEVQSLLYPNPWPKPGQLGRRWHGHPVFPWILALGGTLELRSNWRTYVEEFAVALGVAGVTAAVEPVEDDGDPVSPFERKYLASGHGCWRLGVRLPEGVGVPGGG